MNDHMLPLKIVCFGDSLTSGFQSPTHHVPFPKDIPYGTYLQEWLGTQGEVIVRGVCGETTQDMQTRFSAEVLHHQPSVVVILGGTNDLSLGTSPRTILEHLESVYQQAQNQNIIPVAVTVPSLRDDSWPGMQIGKEQMSVGCSPLVQHAIAQRVELNVAIQALGAQLKIPVIDYFTATCEPITQALALEFSNDGLHLTNTGYLTLATLVWGQVLEGLLTRQS